MIPSPTFSYGQARELLIQLLEQCQHKLNQADWRLAHERLEIPEEEHEMADWITDTALYSYRGRAIDRILPKLKTSDGLAERLKDGLGMPVSRCSKQCGSTATAAANCMASTWPPPW